MPGEGMARNVASLRLVERPRGLFIRRVVNEESDQEEKGLVGKGGRGREARAEKNGKVEFLTW